MRQRLRKERASSENVGRRREGSETSAVLRLDLRCGNLKSIRDLNGNTLTIIPNGITASTGGVVVALGNRLTRISSLPGIPAATYSYDANDRLAADTYDANGNTITSAGKTLTYDFEDRLKTLNGKAVTLVYDGDATSG